ncbi:MAG TPA: hypothetical protein VI299_19500 [Polyangiales bacterium]
MSACAGGNASSALRSAADGTSYALRYPQRLADAERALAEDKQRAHTLNEDVSRITELKIGDPTLARRVADEAHAAGTSAAFAQAYAEERSIAAFWSDERNGLAARVNAATQKELASSPCAQKDLGPTVQHALKDGLDKPLERRLRANNEAHRTLELHRARLPPGSLPSWQRAADLIALASHYANVVIPADARELARLLDERADVERTLGRAVDDERAIQTDPRAGEQRASQERVVEIEKSRAAIAPTAERARGAGERAQADAERAQEEHRAALERVQQHFDAPPSVAVK